MSEMLFCRAPPAVSVKYGEGDVETLEFIRRVQGLGFTLRQIRDLLELRRTRLQPCTPVCHRLGEKLSQVRQERSALYKLERELRAALGSCKKGLQKRSARCPLLGRPKQARQESAN